MRIDQIMGQYRPNDERVGTGLAPVRESVPLHALLDRGKPSLYAFMCAYLSDVEIMGSLLASEGGLLAPG